MLRFGRMNAERGRIVGLALAASIALGAIVPPVLAQAPTTTVSTARTYYRMIVNLAYHGEPTTIEVVVACNVKVTSSRLTGQSWDVTRLPDLYAMRQQDGKSILVQTPDACMAKRPPTAVSPRTSCRSSSSIRTPTTCCSVSATSPTTPTRTRSRS